MRRLARQAVPATAGAGHRQREDGRCAALPSFRDTKPSHSVACHDQPRPPSLCLVARSGICSGGHLCRAEPNTAAASFESFDTTGTASVSKYEYDSDAVFSSMDSDHNNRVSAAELEALLGPQAGGLAGRRPNPPCRHERRRRTQRRGAPSHRGDAVRVARSQQGRQSGPRRNAVRLRHPGAAEAVAALRRV